MDHPMSNEPDRDGQTHKGSWLSTGVIECECGQRFTGNLLASARYRHTRHVTWQHVQVNTGGGPS